MKLYNQTIKTEKQAADLYTRITSYLSKVPDGVRVSVEKVEPGRTENQQARLHCMIREIARSAGCGEDWFKQSYLKRDCEGAFPWWPKKQQRNLQGDIVLVPKSESELTKREEADLLTHLEVFAVEWNVELSESA